MMNTTGADSEMAQPAISEQIMRGALNGENLAEYLDADTLGKLAMHVNERHEIDKESMRDWLDIMDRGIKLAASHKEGEKTYPFSKASDVRYPTVVSAALQYNARTYPAIVPPGDIVQCQVHGEDPEGLKAARAIRTGKFMSYQLREKIPNWERDTDRLTFIGSVVGTAMRKIWYDTANRTPRSRLCLPGKVIVNNGAASLKDAPAITEELEFYPWQIEEKRRAGWWSNVEISGEKEQSEPLQFIEQITRYDLDGDGYAEPIVVTMEKDGQQVVRVAAAYTVSDIRFNPQTHEVMAITPSEFYADYHFFPSFDGGFWGYGLGALLGDISEAINSIINQMIDGAHYASLGGGFIGAMDFRVKGNSMRFSPGEWKQVKSTGQDVRSSMVPMSYPQPSPVMFQMLGLLIDASRELSSTSNVMTGDAASSTMPVGTVMALIEQGMQVYTASYKRLYNAMKTEFRIMARLNMQFLPDQDYSDFFDKPFNKAADFTMDDMDITPVADPKSVTDMQRMGRAQMLLQLAQSGLIDQAEAVTRVLETANIEDVQDLIPKPNPMQGVIQEMQLFSAQLDIKLKAAEIDKKIADGNAAFARAVKDMATAEAEEIGRNLAQYTAQLGALKDMVNNEQGRFSGMAGQPGNGMGVQGPAQSGGNPAGVAPVARMGPGGNPSNMG